MKRLLFVLFVIIVSQLFNTSFPQGNGIKTIVIDAGHGGKDPGCVGKQAKEKDITLSVALKLGEMIKTNHPNINVIYTRQTDDFVELIERAEIANRNSADLFISIHCNASKTKSSYGAETFVMGLHKSDANLEVAKKENSVILLEKDYIKKYDGFDPNSPETQIIFSLYQNAFLEQSLIFASEIQKKLSSKSKRFDRGVKQAGFLVLYKTTMPGVLIEIGFLSNQKEEEFLITDEGQNIIAKSIYEAFSNYKKQIEKKIQISKSTTDLKKNTKNNTDIIYNKPDSTVIAKKEDTTIKNIIENKTISNYNDQDTNKDSDTINIIFKIQILTSSKSIPLNSEIFNGLQDVAEIKSGEFYKYVIGNEKDLEDAIALQKQVINGGFKDAFILVFNNGKRISVEEALKLIQKNKKQQYIKKETKIGIFIIVISVLFFWGFNFLKGRDIFHRKTDLIAIYNEINGLTPSSPVYLNGIKIGQVNDIYFCPDGSGKIVVEFFIQSNIKIPVDSRVTIFNADIMGTKALDIKKGVSNVYAKDNDTIESRLQESIQEQVYIKLRPLVKKIENAIIDIDTILSSIKNIFNDKTQKDIVKLIENTELTMANLKHSTGIADTFLSSYQNQLALIVSNLQNITTTLKNNSSNINNTLRNINSISDSLAKSDLNKTINETKLVIDKLSKITEKINKGEGTIGLLVNNDSLYKQLKNSSENLNNLLIDMKAHPKRYVHFSIFGKKDK